MEGSACSRKGTKAKTRLYELRLSMMGITKKWIGCHRWDWGLIHSQRAESPLKAERPFFARTARHGLENLLHRP